MKRIFHLLLIFSCMPLWAGSDIGALKAEVLSLVKGQSLEISLQAPEGTKLNYDGPWRLTFDNSSLLKDTNKKHFGLESFDKKAQKFQLALNTSQSKKDLKTGFQLVYFLCEKNNKWCKRLVHKSSQLNGTNG